MHGGMWSSRAMMILGTLSRLAGLMLVTQREDIPVERCPQKTDVGFCSGPRWTRDLGCHRPTYYQFGPS